METNTNGKHPQPNGLEKPTTGPLAACLGVLAIFIAGFACGGLALVLVAQPAILNLVSACLAR